MEKLITVTSPLLPDLKEFEKYLEDIWNRKWLTNNGYYHQELEKALADYLGVKYISLLQTELSHELQLYRHFELQVK